jgi:hypothetical protein
MNDFRIQGTDRGEDDSKLAFQYFLEAF